jgi:ribosome-associated protein
MGDTANDRELALAVGRLLADHKAEEPVVLDVGGASNWTDFLVIATARSTVHAMGLIREVDAFLSNRGIRPVNPHKKLTENGWQLVDCGSFVVHVMLKEQREFYALEKLWFKGSALPLSRQPTADRAVSGSADRPTNAASVPASGTRKDHSSKSS